MKLHLNGHLVASDSYDGGLGKSSGGLGNREEILLGAGSWRKDPITDESIEGFLQGKLRSVRFYNRVLTSGEIIRLSTIERSNANDPPFNLNSTAPLQVLENQPIGTQVGLLTADDPDENNTLTFTLVGGALDNHLFTLESNGSLETAAAFDFERISSYAIRAKVRDQYNAWIKKDFIITVLDMDEKDSQNSEDDRNQTNDSKIDENQNDDLDDGLPPVTDGNQTVVDHNDTKPDPTVVEPVTPKYVPIVRTQEVVINDKGAYVFRGRILTDGGAEILEVGIEISHSLSFRKAQRRLAQLVENNFQVKLKDLEPGARYYYRAFAINQVGETKGTRKRLKKIPALPQPSAWWANMPDAGNGWIDSRWFGAFQKFEETEWIYHTQLGWIFAPADSTDGIWFWMEKEGWLWTNRQAWPHLWKHNSGSWLYLHETRRNGNVLFFDYASKLWR